MDRTVWPQTVQLAITATPKGYRWKRTPSPAVYYELLEQGPHVASEVMYSQACVKAQWGLVHFLLDGRQVDIDKAPRLKKPIRKAEMQKAAAYVDILTNAANCPILSRDADTLDTLRRRSQVYEHIARGKMPPLLSDLFEAYGILPVTPTSLVNATDEVRQHNVRVLHRHFASCLGPHQRKTYDETGNNGRAYLYKLVQKAFSAMSVKQIKYIILDDNKAKKNKPLAKQ
jgi:hypothetical protein